MGLRVCVCVCVLREGGEQNEEEGAAESRGESRGDADPSSRLHLAKRIGQNEKLKRQLQPHNEVRSPLHLLLPPIPHPLLVSSSYVSVSFSRSLVFSLGDRRLRRSLQKSKAKPHATHKHTHTLTLAIDAHTDTLHPYMRVNRDVVVYRGA